MRGTVDDDVLIGFADITASVMLMPMAWAISIAFFVIIVWATLGEDYDRS